MRFYDIDVDYFTKKMIDAEEKDKVIREIAGLIIHNYNYAIYELKKEVICMVKQASNEVLEVAGNDDDRTELLRLVNENLTPHSLEIT